MTPWMMVRSILNTPAMNPHSFNKGWKSGADMVILDLEDGVPQQEKAEARDWAIRFLKEPHQEHLLTVRINSLGLREGQRDMLALFDNDARPDAILLSKVDCPSQVVIAEQLLDSEGWNCSLIPIVESSLGIHNALSIAQSSARVEAMVFGAADYCDNMDIPMTPQNLDLPKRQLISAARAADVAIYDAPCFDLQNQQALEVDSKQARNMGFHGKIVLHPNQIQPVNRAFYPTAKCIEEARKVVAAAEEAQGAICTVDGHMVGPPFVNRARRILTQSKETQLAAV